MFLAGFVRYKSHPDTQMFGVALSQGQSHSPIAEHRTAEQTSGRRALTKLRAVTMIPSAAAAKPQRRRSANSHNNTQIHANLLLNIHKHVNHVRCDIENTAQTRITLYVQHDPHLYTRTQSMNLSTCLLRFYTHSSVCKTPIVSLQFSPLLLSFYFLTGF